MRKWKRNKVAIRVTRWKTPISMHKYGRLATKNPSMLIIYRVNRGFVANSETDLDSGVMSFAFWKGIPGGVRFIERKIKLEMTTFPLLRSTRLGQMS